MEGLLSDFSFNYNNQEVQMRWVTDDGSAVQTMGEIVLPDFTLIDIKTKRIEEVRIILKREREKERERLIHCCPFSLILPVCGTSCILN